MGNKHKFKLGGLRLAAITPGSRPALEWPCFEAFSRRRHWDRRRLQRIAAAMCFTPAGDAPRRRAATASYCAVLVNATTGEAVSARTFSVCMEPGESVVRQRVDLVAREDMLHERYDYELEIRSSGTDEVLLSRSLKFYEARRCDVRSLRISATDDVEWPLKGVDSVAHRAVELEFHLDEAGQWPEFELAITDSAGECWHQYEMAASETGTVRFVVPADSVARGEVYFELSNLGRRVAGCVFEFGSTDRCGEYGHNDLVPQQNVELAPAPRLDDTDFDSLLEQFISSQLEPEPETESEPQAEPSALDELEGLVGLGSVKGRVRSNYAMARFAAMRSEAGLPVVQPPMHSMFLGSPGTGKTTVARIMGRLMHEAGLLSGGHVVATERSRLVGKFYGDEEKATLEALEEARGGILFIDEAYQLYRRDDPKDPGRLVLETLMTALSDTTNRDWMLILGGYTAPMLEMLECNPGLSSRLPAANRYVFEDYTAEQLEQIADRYLVANRYEISDEARSLLHNLLRHDCEQRDEHFGNARHVLNLLETGVLPAMAERVVAISAPTVDDLITIRASDIPAPVHRRVRMRQPVGFAV